MAFSVTLLPSHMLSFGVAVITMVGNGFTVNCMLSDIGQLLLRELTMYFPELNGLKATPSFTPLFQL